MANTASANPGCIRRGGRFSTSGLSVGDPRHVAKITRVPQARSLAEHLVETPLVRA